MEFNRVKLLVNSLLLVACAVFIYSSAEGQSVDRSLFVVPDGDRELAVQKISQPLLLPARVALRSPRGLSGVPQIQEPGAGRLSGSYSSDVELSADRSTLINRRCRVQLIREIDVPSLEAGQIAKILVAENAFIQADSAVARLRDDTARLQKKVAEKNRNVAKVDAENDNRLKFAQEGLAMSKDVLKRKEELYRKGNIPYVDFKTSELEAIQSQLQLDEARTQKQVSQEKLSLEEVNIQAADELISRHEVNSLIDGQVAEVYVQVGEWVNRGDKVMRVIQMQKLQISGRADAKELFPGDLDGKDVVVTLQTPLKTTERFNGKVVRVNLENSVSDKYFFVVEVENRQRGTNWLLRPNAVVDIQVLLK